MRSTYRVSSWRTGGRFRSGRGKDTGGKAAFLHRVRAGACRLFGIVLSPDYNAWHAGHLHLQATGGGLCD
ncbi:extensin family protein [Gluconacetobacter diazotrophicus]|uniref:extensin family protein n=1 Tax=Gluconacetobacter diazotrophicus TaxID=33996 RepID=UPI0038CDAE16